MRCAYPFGAMRPTSSGRTILAAQRAQKRMWRPLAYQPHRQQNAAPGAAWAGATLVYSSVVLRVASASHVQRQRARDDRPSRLHVTKPGHRPMS
jgi:hypothetical protein